jgi:hypothetical protein
MAISMDAYATKSEGSSGGGSSDGGGESKGGDSGDGSNDGGGSSGSSNDNGGVTGGDNNPTIEEPSTPSPPIEEPTPTLIAPPPPPTCEQGSTSPECANVPKPPGPPPIDCSTTPNDPSCNTTPGPVDCNTNPDDPSCGPQPPVDCKTNPDDPSCKQPPTVDCKANPNDASCTTQPIDCTTTPNDPSCKPDCTKNPDDPSCKVDCTANPNDPSCPPTPPCQSAVIGISCPPVDCTKTPDDPSCPPPVHIDCPEKVGSTLRAIENGKCVYDPIKCPQGQQLVNNKCSPSGPDEECAFNPSLPKCKATCDENNFCKCPEGFVMNEDDNCRPDKPCPKGFEEHKDDETGKCFKIICPRGSHLQDRSCVRDITVIKHVTTVETVVRNFVSNNQPSSYMLLLDTAQLCQIAGDTQCVAKQNQFDTLNLVTKLDSTGKTWTITGQVENRVSKTQNDMQVTGYFYDSKGNSVGGPYKGSFNPTVLKSHQIAAFSMKPSTSIMKGTPSFIRLEYQSTTTP